MPYKLFILAICATLFSGCMGNHRHISAHGTVKYVDLEGGFYGIRTNSGRQYRPVNLPSRYSVDNLKVKFEGTVRKKGKGKPSVQMWGKKIHITHIEPKNNEKIISGKGMIRYIDLEGGFYGIVTRDGRQYKPVNLKRRFRKNDLKVRFQVKPVEQMGFAMWGTPVKVVSMSKR